MKIITLKSLMLIGAVFSLIACGGGTDIPTETNDAPTEANDTPTDANDTPTETNDGGSGAEADLPTNVQAAIDGPSFSLSQELMNTLSFMGNEERLAYDVYNVLYAKYGSKQFNQIAQVATGSEYNHITAVQALVQKYKLSDDVNFTNIDLPALGYQNTAIEDMEAGTYDIEEIQTLYNNLVTQGEKSEIDALQVGCTIEVVDINDLRREIEIAEAENASDVITVFNFLLEGSYSHYWAFDKGLKNKGVSDGCCSLTEIDGVSCDDRNYPQKDH